MTYLTEAAGRMREPVLEEALREWLARPERPHLAASLGFLALGTQRGDLAANAAVLRAGVDDDGLHGVRRRGALQGLGRQRTAEGREVLAQRLAYGADSHYVRGLAAEAFGASARFGDAAERARALELLSDQTRDPVYGVRMAAVRSLQALGESGGVSVIRSAEAGFALQDHPRVWKAAQALERQGGANGAAKLHKTVESLEDALRELRGRIEDLEARDEAKA